MIKERQMLQIPKDSEAYKYLYEGTNHKNKAKWEIIDEMVKQLPQSKQDRAFKLFSAFVEELEILYPGSESNMKLLWGLIAKRIIKIPDEDGRERTLEDSYYDELKKL